ncbi:MAG: hypothetical protein RMK74_16485 [Myxococcales bacterium]|nr:hypothetical protein [Myxococcales bacterium]
MSNEHRGPQRHRFRLAALVTAAIVLGACGGDDGTGGRTDAAADAPRPLDADPARDAPAPDVAVADVTVPDADDRDAPTVRCDALTEYPREGFEERASVELDVLMRFGAWMGRMREAEMSLDVRPTAMELRASFDGGAPSLRSLTSPYYAALIDGWIDAFAAAAGRSFTPADPPPEQGGLWVSWIFDRRGTDLRQAIEKGSFGAMHLRTAAALLSTDGSPQAVDRALALFGARPSFPRDDSASNPERDRYAAQYAKRRDDPSDGTPGLYRRMRERFLVLRGAAMGGEPCREAHRAAVRALLQEWERVLLATVVYYVQDAATKIGGAAPTEMQLASALHGIGEAVGFVHGLRRLDHPDRILTDAQIDELLGLLRSPPGASAEVYRFVTDPAGELSRLTMVARRIGEIYGFSPAEMEGFRTNY